MNNNFEIKTSRFLDFKVAAALTAAGLLACAVYVGRQFKATPAQNPDPVNHIRDTHLLPLVEGSPYSSGDSMSPVTSDDNETSHISDTHLPPPVEELSSSSGDLMPPVTSDDDGTSRIRDTHLPPPVEESSSSSGDSMQPATLNDDGTDLFLSKESSTISALDLADSTKSKGFTNKTKIQSQLSWLDLGVQEKTGDDDLQFEMPIMLPVLFSPERSPQYNSLLSPQRLFTRNSFNSVTLASYYFTFLSPLIKNGEGRPDNYMHYRKGVKKHVSSPNSSHGSASTSSHQECSSSSHGSASTSSRQECSSSSYGSASTSSHQECSSSSYGSASTSSHQECSSSSYGSASTSSHQVCSSSSQISNNPMIPENEDLMDIYIDSLKQLFSITGKMYNEIDSDVHTSERRLLYKKLKKIKSIFTDLLKRKIQTDLNENYLFQIIQMIGPEQTAIFLANVGLSDDLIQLVFDAFQANNSSQPFRTSEEKVQAFLFEIRQLKDKLADQIERIITPLGIYQAKIKEKNLTKKERETRIERFITIKLPKISSYEQVNQLISEHGLMKLLKRSLSIQISKNRIRYTETNFFSSLKSDYFTCIKMLINKKFGLFESHLSGIPQLPEEIITLLLNSGFVEDDIRGYFIVTQKSVASTSSNSGLNAALEPIRACALNTLDLVIKEQKRHSSARFGDLTKLYRNFVKRSRLIADFLLQINGKTSPENYVERVNQNITGHLLEKKEKNAHREYQGNNQLSPALIMSIETKMNDYISFLPSGSQHICTISPVLPNPRSEGEVLLRIKQILEERERDFIVEFARNVTEVLNDSNKFCQTKRGLISHIKTKLCDIIREFCGLRCTNFAIFQNYDRLLTTQMRHFIQNCIIDCLQKKQHVSKEGKEELYSPEDKKASAMLSLLYGSSEQAVKEIRLMNDRQYRSQNYSEIYLQRAHTLPSPLIFFPETIPQQNYPIDDKVFQTYRGYSKRILSTSETSYLNKKFLKELKHKSQETGVSINDLMNHGVHLSFGISQREFSEVYHLPKIINSEIDAISEFPGYGEQLNEILIDCVNMKENPTKLAIYKRLLPYIRNVLNQISVIISEKPILRKFENVTLLKFIMICNVLQSILATKPVLKTRRRLEPRKLVF